MFVTVSHLHTSLIFVGKTGAYPSGALLQDSAPSLAHKTGVEKAGSVNWRHDTQHNDTQHKNTQHNDTQHKRHSA